MTHPARMIRCHSLDGPESLRLDTVEVPDPGPGEVLVAVRACGINYPDLLVTRGQYQFKPELPFSPGMEVAGVVVACGAGVTSHGPGDRVVARTMTLYPGLTELTCLPASALLPLPDSIDDVTAAGLYLTYYTAYNALVDKARLQAGEMLLVHGAAGGVGLAAVQIGRAIGARVVATAGSAAKLETVALAGAEATLSYAEHPDEASFSDRLRAWAKTHGGVDVVLDPVGGTAFDASVRVLNPEGRLLVVGFTSGSVGQVPANIALIKEISIIGVRAGEYAKRHPEALEAAWARLIGWVEAGLIEPRVARVFPLEEAGAAIAALGDRSHVGKIVVTCS